jgi:hypothetical protein
MLLQENALMRTAGAATPPSLKSVWAKKILLSQSQIRGPEKIYGQFPTKRFEVVR